MNLNDVTLLGNLTRDPEIRYTPSGTAVGDLRLAVNRNYTTGSGEKREEVLFIGIVVWGKTAENCGEYLKKGSMVLVKGRLQSRDWETKEGQKRTTIEVVADFVQFGPKPSGERGERQERPAQERSAGRPTGSTRQGAPEPVDDDEVPF